MKLYGPPLFKFPSEPPRMPYETPTRKGEKCPGSGWPVNGESKCLGCGEDVPLNKRDLVRYHRAPRALNEYTLADRIDHRA